MDEVSRARFAAFGLNIASSFPLDRAFTAQASARADLHVVAGVVKKLSDAEVIWRERAESGSPLWRAGAKGGEWQLEMEGHGRFLLSERMITIDAERDCRAVLLNEILPLWLQARGDLVLHASAVSIGKETIAWAGVSGSGKSTLLAELLSSGAAAFVADDALRVSFESGIPRAHASFPEFRLAARRGEGEKRRYHLTEARDVKADLKAILVLTKRSGGFAVERLTPAAAWEALLPHVYRLDRSPDAMAREMRKLKSVCLNLPVFGVRYPHDEIALGELAGRVLRGLGENVLHAPEAPN